MGTYEIWECNFLVLNNFFLLIENIISLKTYLYNLFHLLIPISYTQMSRGRAGVSGINKNRLSQINNTNEGNILALPLRSP
jgi:hypothetical protein